MYVGGGLAVGLNLHSLNLPVYRGDTLCGVFTSGTSIAPSGSLLFETPLGDPAHSVWIAPRLYFSSLGANITTPATDQGRWHDTINNTFVPITQEYQLDATLLSLGADLFIKYPLTERFFLMGGPSLSYLLQRNATLNEVITAPTDALYKNGTQSQPVLNSGTNNTTGQIGNSTSILAAFTLGASLDVPLSPKVMLAPELTVSAPINSLRTDYNWHVITIALGAELKFNIVKEPKLEVVQAPPPPPPPPSPLPKSEMAASVKISGITTDSAGVEHETSDPQIRIEEFERREAYPALNYIFFDEGGSQIPSRYQFFASPDQAATFHIDSLAGRSTIEVYHEELNILGKRLSDNPLISVTLTGTNSETSREASDSSLALRRAESVQHYLEHVWQIDPSRITVSSEGIPTNPSSTSSTDGSEENRRVEIASSDPGLLDPLTIETIDRTMNPPTIRLRSTESSRIPLVENTLILRQGDRILTSYRGPGTMEQWHPKPEDLPHTDLPLVATMHLTDSLGTPFKATDTANVELLTIRKKREERTQDKIIEHYNLITFSFDKSDLNDRSMRVIAEIAASVTPGTRILVRGYTDVTGESSHNLELSEARAIAVESALRQTLGNQASSVSFQSEGEGQSDLVDNRLPEGRFLSRTVFVELQKPVQ